MMSTVRFVLLFSLMALTCGVPHGRRGGFGGQFGRPVMFPDYGDYFYGFPNSGRGSFGGYRGGQPCPPAPTTPAPLTEQQVQDLTEAFFAATEDEQRLMLKDFLTSMSRGSSSTATANAGQYPPDFGDYDSGEGWLGRGRNAGNRGGHFREGSRWL
uniref:Uncharacterized protein n=1 Tax=Plectus sambesii TaxID=2011161 RepID=A0A914XLZ7_9BILA